MIELQKRGFNGGVKIFQDLEVQGPALSDQVVMHGYSEADAKLALIVAKEFYGDKLLESSYGKDQVVDGKNKSYSQILSDRIQKEVDSKKVEEAPSSTDAKNDIEKLVLTEENYNRWSNVRDKSDYNSFVDQVRSTLAMFDQVVDKSKITPDAVEKTLSSVKAFANKAIRDQVVTLIVAKYKTESPALSDIEAKRADIEKRKKENLEDTGDMFDYVSSSPRKDGRFNAFYTRTKEARVFDTYEQAIAWVESKYKEELDALEGTKPTESKQDDDYKDIPDYAYPTVDTIIQTIKKDSESANAEFIEDLKQIAPADSVANKTHEFEYEIVNGIERYRITGVNPNYVFDMATKDFMPGKSVYFKVLTDGFEPIVNRLTDEKYDKTRLFNEGWKVNADMYDYAPIGIYSNIRGKEVLVGFVHEPQWIEFTKKGKNDQIHFPHIVVPAEDINNPIPEVVKKEAARLRELRRVILDGYNKDSKFVYQGNVMEKSIGVLRVNGKPGLIKDRVNPKIGEGGKLNPHGMFGIVRNGVIQIRPGAFVENLQKTETFREEKALKYEGVPVLILPTPTGTMFPTFMNLPTLDTPQIEFILEAWKAFTGQTNNPELIKAVYDAVAIEVPEGSKPVMDALRMYIKHFINKMDSRPLSESGKGVELPDNTARLNIDNSGKFWLQAKVNGKWYNLKGLTKASELPEDIYDIMSKLRTTIRFTDQTNKDLHGINSTKPVSILTYQNGKLNVEKMTYNQYIMSKARTTVEKGIESKTANKDWVYFANPVIKFDVNKPQGETESTPFEEKSVVSVTPPAEKDAGLEDLMQRLERLAGINNMSDKDVKDESQKCGDPFADA